MVKNVSKNRLTTVWTSLLTTTLIFLLVGFLLVGDGTLSGVPWWCWIIPAFAAVEAIRVTIQYAAGEHTRVCPNCHRTTPISNQFCDKCGYDLRGVTYENYGKIEDDNSKSEEGEQEPPKQVLSSKNYCVTCGGPLEGSEAYCPTCGMPLKK